MMASLVSQISGAPVWAWKAIFILVDLGLLVLVIHYTTQVTTTGWTPDAILRFTLGIVVIGVSIWLVYLICK